MPSAVFCYARPDAGVARELGAYLELNCAVEAYFEEGLVKPGFDLVAAAERGVAADVAIVLLSSHSVPREWIRERWEPVFEPHNRIACVLLGECKFPQLLRRRTFFDYSRDAIAARRGLKRWILGRDRAQGSTVELPRLEPGHVLAEKTMEELRRRLADEAGSECLDREEALRFAHACGREFEGAFWIQCANRGATGILGDTAHALGLRLTGPVAENRKALREFSAAHRCLYVFEEMAEEHWAMAELGGKASVMVTLPGAPAHPRPLEELRGLFGSWMRNEEACLRALGEVERHLRGGEWPAVEDVGLAAVALLKHRERLAEAHELLELLAKSASAAGDPTRVWQLRWDQAWILERWGQTAPREHAPAPSEAAQLSLDFA